MTNQDESPQMQRQRADSSGLAEPRVLIRVFLQPGQLDTGVEFYEKLQGTEADAQWSFPAKNLRLATVGAFLLIEGSEDDLRPFRSTTGTLLVDDMQPYYDRLVADGAEIIFPLQHVPTGAAFNARHPDGTVVEYVHHRPTPLCQAQVGHRGPGQEWNLMEHSDAATPAWATEEVHVVEPDPEWAAKAECFAAEIRELLDGWFSGPVAHVGSTAVPGLAAKPIIDLQAAAADPAEAMAARQHALAAAAWFLVPRELDQRAWRWFVVRADAAGQRRLAHLHLMRLDEPRWHEQLAFRDALRASPSLTEEYARLKSHAARQHRNDREAYTNAKQAFIRRTLNQNS